MARSSLTVTTATVDALRAAKPALSMGAGRILTLDGCVIYLLRHWLATHPLGPQAPPLDTEPAADGRARRRARA